ncbi:MAG: M23 family metallopeptidase [Syntrophorhabdus sp.]|nr:M23 family metallopeptidase [Syntrophorhabdus sp.]
MNRSHAAYGIVVLTVVVCFVFLASSGSDTRKPVFRDDSRVKFRKVSGTVRKGDVLSRLFKRNNLQSADLRHAKEAADGVYDLGRLCSGRPYSMTIDTDDRLHSLTYWIDDDTYLNLSRDGDSLTATIEKVEYENRQLSFGGVIRDNLVASLGPGRNALLLALDLSDIFAWDMDFNTDLREGDTFRIVVEGLFTGNTFRRFGSILSAEFINNGQRYLAYRYEVKGNAGYYDADGRPLRRAFLKAPLNFRRISSHYTGRRFHPILKVHRPHRGIDYVAATGTPVSALGDGVVSFSGRRGGYGKLVIIRHRNGYSTWYGHLSSVAKGIRNGSRVEQGDIIGRVGSTGLATGPHLHFEMRVAGRAVNPLRVRCVRAEPLGAGHRPRFREYVASMNRRLTEAVAVDDMSIPSMLAAMEKE